MSTITNSTQLQKIAPISKLWRVGLVAAGASALGNVVFFLISRGLGVPYLMPAGPESTDLAPLSVMIVMIASVVPAVAATSLYTILGKFLSRPILVFWIISAVALVLSFGLPFTLPAEVDRPTIFALEVMHIISGIAIVGVLTTLGRQK